MPSWLPQLMQDRHLRRVVLIRASLWTLTIALFMGLGSYFSAREARETALARVHDHFDKEILLRSWVSERGGVYVPLDDKTPANPYLKDILDHEITTTRGKVFTLVNPAYLARLLHEQNRTGTGITSRLTSLKPIRPENAPDGWEQKAFARIETGQREYWEEVRFNGRPQIRYLGALITEQACLPCHAHQGYQVGDIRGGISITVPLMQTTGLLGTGVHHVATQVAMFGLWLFGLAAILLAGRWNLHRHQELVQAEALLHATHLQSKAVLEAAQVGTWEWNIQTGETVFNSVYARLLGYTHKDLPPLTIKAWEGICHPDDHGRVAALAARCYSGKVPDYDCELRLRHKDGHWVWLWDRGSLVGRTEAGEPLLMAGIGTDITARKEAEQTLISLNTRLETRVAEEVARNLEQARYMEQKARTSEMGEMVSAIAHQWRQPLNTLSIILANMKDAARCGDLTRPYLEEKLTQGDLLIQKMSTTINDFMSYFWGDKTVEVFSVRQAVQEAMALVEAGFQHHAIALTLDGNEDALIKGYLGEFSQVLMNLLFNARDAIAGQRMNNGAVWMNILVADSACQLTITDNGGGIQGQPIERIFAPYTSSKPQGSGLGLFLSRRIIEHSLGGQLKVRNTDNGAEFTLVLPIAEVTHDAQ